MMESMHITGLLCTSSAVPPCVLVGQAANENPKNGTGGYRIGYHQLLQIVNNLTRVVLIFSWSYSLCLCQVSPPYDMAGTTALVAANLLFEMLCVLPGVEYKPKGLQTLSAVITGHLASPGMVLTSSNYSQMKSHVDSVMIQLASPGWYIMSSILADEKPCRQCDDIVSQSRVVLYSQVKSHVSVDSVMIYSASPGMVSHR